MAQPPSPEQLPPGVTVAFPDLVQGTPGTRSYPHLLFGVLCSPGERLGAQLSQVRSPGEPSCHIHSGEEPVQRARLNPKQGSAGHLSTHHCAGPSGPQAVLGTC